MQISLLLAKSIISMFLMACVGLWAVRSGRFSLRDADTLSRLNVTIVYPCAIFNSFQIEFSMDKITGFLTAMAAAAVIHLIFVILEKLLRRPLNLSPAESVTVIYSNCLNLIVPIVASILDQEMVFYCSAYMLVQTFLLWTHGKMLVSGQNRFTLQDMMNPNILAMILGFAAFVLRLRLPGIPAATVSGLGSLIGPSSMLVMGMLIGNMDLKAAFTNIRIYLIASLRLILFPVLIIPVLRYSGLMRLHPNTPAIFLVSIVATASCSASCVPQLCQVYGSDSDYAGMLNAITLALCILTMPLIVLIYQLVMGL